MKNKISSLSIGVIIVMALLISGCAAPTAAPTATSVPTDTPAPTNTPAPTDTPTSTPTETPTSTSTPTETPTPTPTKTATPDYGATKTVVAIATSDALKAEIKTELETLGLPTEGDLAWYAKEDQTLSVTEYGEQIYEYTADEMEFKNFILKVDLQWDSKSGAAGCGIIFRASSKVENGPQYRMMLMRLSGLPLWDIEHWDYNEFVANVMGEVKASNLIDISSGATNTFILLANKDLLSVYANGKRLGSGSSTAITGGKIAWMAWQESGETVCSFQNTWIWQLP